MAAVPSSDFDTIRFLIARGDNVRARTKDGYAAL
jgi:hypothetical protein